VSPVFVGQNNNYPTPYHRTTGSLVASMCFGGTSVRSFCGTLVTQSYTYVAQTTQAKLLHKHPHARPKAKLTFSGQTTQSNDNPAFTLQYLRQQTCNKNLPFLPGSAPISAILPCSLSFYSWILSRRRLARPPEDPACSPAHQRTLGACS
jgi:hypothetical protein